MALQREREVDDAVRHALGNDLLIDITTTGRKTGDARRIEIGFRYMDGRLFITGRPEAEMLTVLSGRDRRRCWGQQTPPDSNPGQSDGTSLAAVLSRSTKLAGPRAQRHGRECEARLEVYAANNTGMSCSQGSSPLLLLHHEHRLASARCPCSGGRFTISRSFSFTRTMPNRIWPPNWYATWRLLLYS